MTSLDNKYKINELAKLQLKITNCLIHFSECIELNVCTPRTKLQRKRPTTTIALFIYTLSFGFSGRDASR